MFTYVICLKNKLINSQLSYDEEIKYKSYGNFIATIENQILGIVDNDKWEIVKIYKIEDSKVKGN